MLETLDYTILYRFVSLLCLRSTLRLFMQVVYIYIYIGIAVLRYKSKYKKVGVLPIQKAKSKAYTRNVMASLSTNFLKFRRAEISKRYFHISATIHHLFTAYKTSNPKGQGKAAAPRGKVSFQLRYPVGLRQTLTIAIDLF